MLRRLLIVDPDPKTCRELAAAFPGDEFLVRTETAGASGLTTAAQWRPECIVLATAPEGLSGFEVCRRIKLDRAGGRLPILLTAPTRDQNLVNRGLREGADDFLQKPCHPQELLWRVRGLLRRYEAPAAAKTTLKVGPIELDAEQGLVLVEGEELALTKKELLLLELFLRNPGRVLTRRFLLESIWGYDSSVRTRVVDLCVFQLRRKLAVWGRALETRRSFGYVLRTGGKNKTKNKHN